MKPALVPAALLACLALVAAGCGADDAEDQARSAAEQAESVAEQARTEAESVAEEARSVAEDATGEAGGEVKISMVDILYKPAEAEVKVGQKVTWTNDDPVAHTVTARNGEFDSGTVQSDETYSFTPEKAGDIPYFCEVHPNQRGTLKVTG